MTYEVFKSQADFLGFFKEVFDHQRREVFGDQESLLKADKESFTLILNQGQEILAAAQCSRLYQTLKIHNLAVRSSHQGQGLGRDLILKIKAYAEEQAIQKLVLTTRSYQARDFYLKQGFEEFAYLDNMPFEGVGTSYMIYHCKKSK